MITDGQFGMAAGAIKVLLSEDTAPGSDKDLTIMYLGRVLEDYAIQNKDKEISYEV